MKTWNCGEHPSILSANPTTLNPVRSGDVCQNEMQHFQIPCNNLPAGANVNKSLRWNLTISGGKNQTISFLMLCLIICINVSNAFLLLKVTLSRVNFNFLIFCNVYWFLRDRQNTSGGRGRERRRPRIWSRFQGLSCQHRTRHGAQTHEPRDHDLSRSQTLNWLSHSGAPPNKKSLKASGASISGWAETNLGFVWTIAYEV